MLQPGPCPWITSLTLLAGPAAFREHTLDGPNVGCAACSPGHLSGWHWAHLQGDLPGPGWQFQEVIYILLLGGLLGGGALLSPLLLSTTTCLPRLLQPSVCQRQQSLRRAREKHWLVSHWNAKGTVLWTPCQLIAQENKELLGDPDTGQLEALESGVALRALRVGKGAICTHPRGTTSCPLAFFFFI